MIDHTRARGHRYAGTVTGRSGERHWIAAVIGLAGTAASVGLGAASAASQPSGRMNAGQRRFLAEQQARQEQSFQLQQMLQPFMLESMGLTASYGPNGQITGITRRPPTQTEQQALQIQELANEKVLKGLRGELDIDPATERRLRMDDRIREEGLHRSQGQSGDQSTTSQTSRELGRESDRIVREAVRRGEMTNAQAIATTEANQAFRENQFRAGLMAGLPGQNQNLIGSAFDYPGFGARQDFLSGTLGANRYGAFGNIIGQGGASLGPIVGKLFGGSPSPAAPPPAATYRPPPEPIDITGNVFPGEGG